MARYVYAIMSLVLLTFQASANAPGAEGKLSIFRWNQGYRAEREPVFEGKLSEPEFRSMVRDGKLPASENIYAGCYLAHFEPARSPDRSPASSSAAKPKSEVFRICR